MALTATVLAVELILAISALLSRVPIAVGLSYVHSILWQYQRHFQPQRNLFLYGLWLVLGTGIYACLCWLMQLSKGKPKWDLNAFLILHILVVCLMCHAGFEIVAMNNPVWAWPVFWGAFIAGVLISIFWPELSSGAAYLKQGETVTLLFKETEVSIGKGLSGLISLRNRFPAAIKKLEKSDLLSKVFLDYKSKEIVSIITTRSAQKLGLNAGDQVEWLVKTNEVSLLAACVIASEAKQSHF